MADVRHVVLAKPGDVLLIGNLGAGVQDDETEALQRLAATFRDVLAIDVVVFEADIDIDAVSGGSG